MGLWDNARVQCEVLIFPMVTLFKTYKFKHIFKNYEVLKTVTSELLSNYLDFQLFS